MTEHPIPKSTVDRPRSWSAKFANAVRGVGLGAAGQSSFAVHGVAILVVAGCAVGLGVSPVEWCALLLCIGLVLTAELINSAIEHLARAVTEEHHPLVGAALDIASGAVLVAALISVLIGGVVFIPRLLAIW